MGLEPALSRTAQTWPLAGIDLLPPEPDDPRCVIPKGVLDARVDEAAEAGYLAGDNPSLEAAGTEPLTSGRARQPEQKRRWSVAIVASVLFHLAVAATLLAMPSTEPELLEGIKLAESVQLGDAPDDQRSSGEQRPAELDSTNVTLVTMLAPKPVQTVTAETVEPTETLQPAQEHVAQADVSDPIQPVEEASTQPAPAEHVEPSNDQPMPTAEQPADPLPEILTADALKPEPDEVVVPKPAETKAEAVQEEVVQSPAPEPQQPKKVAPEKKKPVKEEKATAERTKAKEKPVRKAESRKKPAARQADEVAEAATKKPRSGNSGRNAADSRRGVADGNARGNSAASNGAGRNSDGGKAALSKYKAKVQARLQRVARGFSGSGRGTAIVSFVIGSNGGVSGIRLTKSSGSPAIDKAALAAVQRASPFPPLPPESGLSRWPFAAPLGL